MNLSERASVVLESLWLGSATKPAAHLYPHQWSWDSAFIAIGNRHHRWDRAAVELRTLFDAQWHNGMVPHIVFSDEGGEYFPNAGFWDVAGSCSPAPPRASSGICQPPVHATAALKVYEAQPGEAGLGLLRDLFPKLCAWHDYLHNHRAVGSDLAEVWHPWETGMDNSPAWDQLLNELVFEPSEVPPYKRVDNTLINSDDRPSDAEYDRYAYLVENLRLVGYQPDDPEQLPFRVRDVLFNSALARAEFDLATIAGLIGEDGSNRASKGDRISRAIEESLWDQTAGIYKSQNAQNGQLIESRISGGLMPLLVPMASDRLATLVGTLDRSFAVPSGDDGFVVLTVPEDDPGFDAVRYWRGPSWIQINWLVAEGLETNGQLDLASQLRRGIHNLVAVAGFHEYFNPRTMCGHGTDGFGWTAALLIDVANRTSPGQQ